MKKILLGTTALVAATAVVASDAKAEIAIDMAVYQAFGFAVDSDDQASTQENAGLGTYQNNSINFVASTELDNGMTVGMTHAVSKSETLDEIRFSLSDDWGIIDIGSNDSAADIMSHSSFAVTYNSINSGTWSSYSKNWGKASNTAGSFSGDAQGIRYFSPVMNGLRIGTSYQSRVEGDTGAAAAVDRYDSENILSAAIEYSGDMDGISIGFGAGVDHAASYNPANGGTVTAGDDDRTQVRAGGSIGVAGFTLGVGYFAEDTAVSTIAQQDLWAYQVMLAYSAGPHTIGVEYVNGERDTTQGVGGETEDTGFLIGYNYSIGSGVYWDARLALLDTDGPTAGTKTDDSDVTVFETGLGISF